MNAITIDARQLAAAGHVTAGDTPESDVARAAAGDVRAFERLYHRHVDQVRRLAERMAGDEADDATQDIFIRAWAKLGSYRKESSFATWLHRLAINVLIRRAQRRRRLWNRVLSGDLTRHPAVREAHDTRMDVSAALATLPPDVRAVVVLHDLEGYSHVEIASMLGIGLSATRMRLHRARLALRPLVDAFGENDV